MENATVLRTILLICLAVGIAGCFEYDAELKVNRDGSGTLVEKTLFTQQATGMMSMMAQGTVTMKGSKRAPGPPAKPVDPFKQMIDKEKLARKAKRLGKGVTVKSAKVITSEDGRKGVQVVFAFRDVNEIKLPLWPGETMETSFGGGGAGPGRMDLSVGAPAKAKDGKEKKDEFATFKFTKAVGVQPARLTIIMPKPKKAETRPAGAPKPEPDDAPGKVDPQEMAMQKMMMRQFMEGMRMRNAVTVNGKIVKTDATHPLKGGAGLILIEMRMGDLLKDDKAFAKLDAMKGDMTMTEAKKRFADPDLQKYVKIETRETVHVEFK